jgi:hypothetical protein
MDDILRKLEDLPSSKWGLHETFLCQELGIKANEGASVRTQLMGLLVALKNAGSGNKREKTWTNTGYDSMDLAATSTRNELDIHYYKHGDKELFAADPLKQASGVLHNPRYFILGAFTASDKGQQKFDRIKIQCNIMKHVTGEAINLLDEGSRLRRQAKWLLWYQKSDEDKEFERKDLPALAIQFREYWDVTISEDEQGRIPGRMPPGILSGVAKEIRRILQCCNRIPSRTRQGASIKVVTPNNKRKRAQDDDTTKESTEESAKIGGLPQSLTLKALRNLISSGPLEELGAIELAVRLLSKEKVSVTLLADSFKNAGVGEPTSIGLDELLELGNSLHVSAKRNVSTARKELIDGLPAGLFSPQEGDMLHAWITDGKRYTDGERLPAVNYEKHPVSNQMCLTDKAAHYIRSMVYCHKIPIRSFPSLWNAFALLMIGRPLKLQEFSSSATLRYRFQRLYMIDRYRFRTEFEKYITARSEKGFYRLWYMVTDDSKHHDRDRHVCLMSAHRAEDPSDTNASPNPCFRLLTASVAPSKDSDGNASLNVSAASECLPISAAVSWGQAAGGWGGQAAGGQGDV